MADLTFRLVKGSPLTNVEVDANFSNLNEAITIGGEPMGHEDKAQSTLSFDAGTRTVTIAPVSGSFTVWVKGKKFVFTTAQSVVIPNTTGLHYVYFNTSGVLSSHMTFFDWPNEAMTAYVAWNAATGAAPFFGDERHGVTLDWQTHEYLHRTRGAALANGFSISNYAVVGDGSSDAHAQLDLSGGTFFDEDLQVDITHSNTPTPNTWQQPLAGPAQIPVLYRSGSGWVRDTPTNFILKAGTATPRYNTESGGVWGLTDVPNNSYSVVWVLATNNLTYPVVAIMGQYADNNSSNAENFEWGSMNLDGFPSIEFRPLYKIVFRCSTSYTNTIKARFTKVFDVRNLVAASPAATIGSSHGGLSGLGADDHQQYLHVSEVRSPSAAVKNSLLPPQSGNNGKFLTTDGSNPSWATMTAPNNGTLTLATSGSGLSGSASFTADQAGNSTFTVTIASASANTADTLVLRDSSGNFSANVITANSFSGSASGLTGFKTVNGNNILGAGNIQIDGGVTSFNTRTGAITLSSADVTGALGYTPYNSTNPNGYTSNAGTVTGVTAGTGLAGGTITSSGTISLATSGVTAGTYTKVTVDAYGRATSGASLSSSDVTTALGYTPYNSTNPNGYITSSALSSYLPLSGGTMSGGLVINSGTTNQLQLNTSTGTQSLWVRAGYDSDGTATPAVSAFNIQFQSSGSSGGTFSFVSGNTKVLAIGGGAVNSLTALQQSGNQVLHAGNYTSYSPSLTGSGASGTWGISITGSAGSVAWTNVSGRPTAVSSFTNDSGYLTSGSTINYAYYQAPSGTSNDWVTSFQSTPAHYTSFREMSANGPSGTWWFMQNLRHSNSSNYWGVQIAWGWEDNANNLYTRNITGNSFGGWVRYLNSSNYTSYSPSLTGSGASGTWGISITGNSNTLQGYQWGSSGKDVRAQEFYADGWLRNYNSGTGLYNQATYNHFYSDGQYWNVGYSGTTGIRLRNGHAGSILGYLYAETSGNFGLLHNGGGWSVQVYPGGNGYLHGTWNGGNIRANRANGNFYIDDNYGCGVVGTYASTRYQGVFAMGDSYKLPADGTSTGSLYGMAWSHPNAGGVAGNLDSHGMIVMINGGFGSCMSYSIRASGNVTAYSDERLKTNWRGMPENFVARLAQVKVGIYDRVDGEQITQVGVSAQSLQRLLPQAITTAKDEMGTLAVSYGNAALASAVELAKDSVELRARIERLEALINKLIGD